MEDFFRLVDVSSFDSPYFTYANLFHNNWYGFDGTAVIFHPTNGLSDKSSHDHAKMNAICGIIWMKWNISGNFSFWLGCQRAYNDGSCACTASWRKEHNLDTHRFQTTPNQKQQQQLLKW